MCRNSRSLAMCGAMLLALLTWSAPTLAAPPEGSGASPEQTAGDSEQPAAQPAKPEGPPPNGKSDDDAADDELQELDPEIISIQGRVTPGAVHSVDAAELEQFERDDVHHVLSSIPGVYVREEEGYGLRPNIGMRGSGSERSAKIALLEDGVLIAPAPYSAPAAYYFPLVTRMHRVEVTKGPGAIENGPNTVGGAVNLISKPFPAERGTSVDLAAGANLYGKVHATHVESGDHFGAMLELAKLRSDGFKHIDGGGDTGFDKNDILFKLRANTDRSGSGYHQLTLKVGYSEEVSNETYTGLANTDFSSDPFRRYAGTQLDRLDWEHRRAQLTHRFEAGDDTVVLTDLYYHRFDRRWRKLNGFDSGRSLRDILANPNAGANAVFYSILTGESDSTSDTERLLIGTNDREFSAVGLQSRFRTRFATWGVGHAATVGVRIHHDQVDRQHREEFFMMQSGALAASNAPERVNRDAVGSALAFAGYARDEIELGPVHLTAGVRTEVIRTEWRDRQNESRDSTDTHVVVIPGAGLHYQATPWLALFGGVHRGFVPGAPSPSGTAAPEKSLNYELGARAGTDEVRGELLGFFNDYSNLKGTCTFSSGCMEDQVDEEFAAGRVHIWGVEASGEMDLLAIGPVRFPARFTYTYTNSAFQNSFRSDNPQWGSVSSGDELPYLPSHQLMAQLATRGPSWEVALSTRHTGSMRDIAGSGELVDGEHAPAYTVFDAAAHYQFGRWGRLYATLTNLFDDEHIVSLRPFGARPGAPRRFVLGYKNEF